jgi:hypothetical protein
VTRWLIVLLASAMCAVGTTACGGVEGRASSDTNASAVKAPKDPYAGDQDGEGDRSGRDADDNDQVFGFGRAATAAETGAVTALVERYFAAARARDGGLACSLMYSTIAGTIVEDYGRPPGPPSLSGSTCAEVMSKFFKSQARRIAHDTGPRVTQVRVKGIEGLAVLDLGSRPVHHIPVQREHGVWKVSALLDSEMH